MRLLIICLSWPLGACGGHTPDDTVTSANVESFAPERGELVKTELGGRELGYELHDGLAVFEGDIVLGQGAEVAAKLEAIDAGEVPRSAICNFDFGFGCATWTDGVIGYGFADNWGSPEANGMMRARILAAMQHWEDRTSLRFVPRTDGERVLFGNAGGCSSDIGRAVISFPQTVRLATSCGYGAVVHEIGHTVGMWHEQARSDRDDYITIDLGAIDPFHLHDFWGHGELGRDIGPYDFASIMHYPCDAWSRDGRDTIRPIVDGITCADIGQRAALSEGDVLAAYWLYKPRYNIGGASPGATDDRFDLRLVWDTEAVRPEYIRWSSDRGLEGSGATFTLRASDAPTGPHTITASIVINTVTVVTRSLVVNLGNSTPGLTLEADRVGYVNRMTFVTARVDDAEDGICPAADCAYVWDPPPDYGAGGSVGYTATSPGARVVSVSVTDVGGAVATGSVTIDFIDPAPEVTIQAPLAAANYALGAGGTRIAVAGSATDANAGPGPGPGAVPCNRLYWTSSVGSDTFEAAYACATELVATTPGARTVTLTAFDSRGQSSTASVTIDVDVCVGNCTPNVSFVFETPEDFHDDVYDNAVYFLSTPIRMTATLRDGDVPPDALTYRWLVYRPCFGTGPCPPREVGSGAATSPATRTLTWRPSNDIEAWSNCASPGAYVPFSIALEVEDARGATNEFAVEVTLGCSLD